MYIILWKNLVDWFFHLVLETEKLRGLVLLIGIALNFIWHVNEKKQWGYTSSKKSQIHRCYWKMFLIITLWLWIFHAFRICAGSLQSFKVCASEVPEHKLIKVMCKFSTLNLTFGAQIRLRPDFCIKIHWIFCPPYYIWF